MFFLNPQDTRALLHTNSFHQTHTFKGIVKSQLIRFHRICIRQHDVDRATTTLFGTFLRSIKVDVERGFEGGEYITRVEQNKNLVPLVTTSPQPPILLNSC